MSKTEYLDDSVFDLSSISVSKIEYLGDSLGDFVFDLGGISVSKMEYLGDPIIDLSMKSALRYHPQTCQKQNTLVILFLTG